MKAQKTTLAEKQASEKKAICERLEKQIKSIDQWLFDNMTAPLKEWSQRMNDQASLKIRLRHVRKQPIQTRHLAEPKTNFKPRNFNPLTIH